MITYIDMGRYDYELEAEGIILVLIELLVYDIILLNQLRKTKVKPLVFCS